MNNDSSTGQAEKAETAFIELALEMLDWEASDADDDVATESLLRTAAELHKSLES